MLLDEQIVELKENRLNIELYNKLEREGRVSDLKLCEPIIDNSKYLVGLMTVIRDKISENYHTKLN